MGCRRVGSEASAERSTKGERLLAPTRSIKARPMRSRPAGPGCGASHAVLGFLHATTAGRGPKEQTRCLSGRLQPLQGLKRFEKSSPPVIRN